MKLFKRKASPPRMYVNRQAQEMSRFARRVGLEGRHLWDAVRLNDSEITDLRRRVTAIELELQGRDR